MGLDTDLENMRSILYECYRCGEIFDGSELINRIQIKCPHCGYKILKKVRPPRAKMIKAI
jgi:DNA-directed RNA polymerase subunit P